MTPNMCIQNSIDRSFAYGQCRRLFERQIGVCDRYNDVITTATAYRNALNGTDIDAQQHIESTDTVIDNYKDEFDIAFTGLLFLFSNLRELYKPDYEYGFSFVDTINAMYQFKSTYNVVWITRHLRNEIELYVGSLANELSYKEYQQCYNLCRRHFDPIRTCGFTVAVFLAELNTITNTHSEPCVHRMCSAIYRIFLNIVHDIHSYERYLSEGGIS